MTGFRILWCAIATMGVLFSMARAVPVLWVVYPLDAMITGVAMATMVLVWWQDLIGNRP